MSTQELAAFVSTQELAALWLCASGLGCCNSTPHHPHLTLDNVGHLILAFSMLQIRWALETSSVPLA